VSVLLREGRASPEHGILCLSDCLKQNLPAQQGKKDRVCSFDPCWMLSTAYAGGIKRPGIPMREKLVGLGLETIARDLGM